MRKALRAGGKGQSGNQLFPTTLLTHLRGPPVLSYGHFGSSWARPTSGLRQPPTVPTAQTTSKIARLPLLAADVLHPYRDLIEIVSAVRSDKCLDLVTWPSWPFGTTVYSRLVRGRSTYGPVLSHSGEIHRMGRILRAAASLVTGLALAATATVGTVPAEAATRCDVTFKTHDPIREG